MILPVGASIKIASGIPQLDKISIPSLTALAGCVIFAKYPFRLYRRLGLIELLLLILVFSPLVTSLLNLDTVRSGPVILPGVGFYDGLSAIAGQFLFILPFFLGRLHLSNSNDLEQTLKITAAAGIVYSLPMLYEIRMSPQLHNILYGYFPFGFSTQMREGGFRPSVFLDNGLVASFFLMTAIIASVTLWRLQKRVFKTATAVWTAYLSGVLVLCKSLGSLVYGLALAPIAGFARPRTQVKVACLLAVIAVFYPLLRAADLIPTNSMVTAASWVDKDRAGSLEVRFDQEKPMLDRALERMMFGWGRYGRSRIFDDWGHDISVTDGRWIITLGQFGIVGFLAEFGLLTIAIFSAATAVGFAETPEDAILLAAISLIVAVNMIDLLPNASLSPWTWLLTGALVGRKENIRATMRVPRQILKAGMPAEAEQPVFRHDPLGGSRVKRLHTHKL